MAQTKIQLNRVDEVKELVNAAEKCDFDVDLSCGRIIVDAKSILGILSIGLNKTVMVQCHGDNDEFNYAIRKFAVA